MLDARRLHDHQLLVQFTENAINSQETKKKMIADSYTQGFTALPGYGIGGTLIRGLWLLQAQPLTWSP